MAVARQYEERLTVGSSAIAHLAWLGAVAVLVLVVDFADWSPSAIQLSYVALLVLATFLVTLPQALLFGVGSLTLLWVAPSTLPASSLNDVTLRCFTTAGMIGAMCTALAQRWRNNRIAAELERMKEQGQRKDDFLARLSHELRTPLTAIIGFAEFVCDREPDDGNRATHEIKANGAHLLDLTNDMLDLAKTEADRLVLRKHDVALVDLLTGIQPIMNEMARAKGLRLHFEFLTKMPSRIKADGTRLRQILINLIGNAIKFTQQGTVRVATRTRSLSDSTALVFEITDTGPGIPTHEIETLFEPFARGLTAAAGTVGGSGLGLAITRQLVQLFGGTIEVLSREGAGSTFTALIPIEVDQHARFIDANGHNLPCQEHLDEPDVARLGSCRVLLAEDVPSNQLLICRYLEAAGASVTVVETGRDAVTAVRHAPTEASAFDVILMDMHMPVMNGYDAVQELRSQSCETPIIALTASAMRNDREQCLAAGCVDYLSKPIDRSQLIETVGRCASARPQFAAVL